MKPGDTLAQGDVVIRPSVDVPGTYTARVAVRDATFNAYGVVGAGESHAAALQDLIRRVNAVVAERRDQKEKASRLRASAVARQGFGGRR